MRVTDPAAFGILASGSSTVTGSGPFDVVANLQSTDTSHIDLTMAAGSSFTGTTTRAGSSQFDLTLADSRWNLTGNSSLSALVNDPSLIVFSPPSTGGFKTLTVTSYVGQGGGLQLNTYLGTDGSPSDRLVVNGGAATGRSTLAIANAGGPGAATNANGIQVVETVNGATTAQNAFSLSGRAVAGAYEYQLYRGSKDASNPDAWYLRSEQSTPPAPPAPPSPPSPPAPAPEPLYRPEVGAYLANQRNAAGLFLHSLHDRLGEPQWIEQQGFAKGDDQPRSGWLRIVGKDISTTSRDGNFDVDTDSWLIHGGGDVARWAVTGDKDRIHLGAMLGYGWSRSDATATDNPYAAKGKVAGWNLGVYGTWYQNDADPQELGWYADVWGTYGSYRNTVDGDALPEVKYDSSAWTASGETGYAMRIQQGSDWIFEPQAQLAYIRMNVDNVTEPNGTHVGGQDGSGWIGRLGVRVHRTWTDEVGNRTQPYLTLNYWSDHVDNEIGFNQLVLKDLYPDSRWEVKLGINAMREKSWSYWSNLGFQWSSQDYRAVTLRLGAKRTW